MASRERRVSMREERLELRTTREQKALLRRAAALEGRTLTDFVVASAQDAARRTLAEHALIVLSERDQRTFATALLAPPEPAPALGAAVRRRARRTRR